MNAGRGRKVCQNCQEINGVRARNCVHCGKGFCIKGFQHPDIIVDDIVLDKVNKTRKQYQEKKKKEKETLTSLVDRYFGEDDKRRREKHDIEGRTWQTKCGRYRVCERLTFMGVNIKSGFEKPFYIYKHGTDDWEPIKPNHRFKSLKKALMKIYQLVKGKRFAKPTSQKEKKEEMKLIREGKIKTDKQLKIDKVKKLNGILQQ